MDIQVNMAPSWGEMGVIVRRLAMSGEHAALRKIWPDVAQAFAAAEALNKILPQLSEAQKMVIGTTLTQELSKQGL